MTANWAPTAGLSSGAAMVLTDSNLTVRNGGDSNSTVHARASAPVSGSKVYFEGRFVTVPGIRYGAIGVIDAAVPLPSVNSNLSSATWMLCDDGKFSANGGGLQPVLPAFLPGDIAMVLLDLAAGKMWVGRNGVWAGNPGSGTGWVASGLPAEVYAKATAFFYQGATGIITVNFGATPFAYSIPAGAVAYNDALVEPPGAYADPLSVPNEMVNPRLLICNAVYPIERTVYDGVRGKMQNVPYASVPPPYQWMAASRPIMGCLPGDYIEAEIAIAATWEKSVPIEWAGMFVLRRVTDEGPFDLYNAGPTIDFRCMSENSGINLTNENALHHFKQTWIGKTTVLLPGDYRVDWVSYVSKGPYPTDASDYVLLHDGVMRCKRWRDGVL